MVAITITVNLNWHAHVSSLTNAASQELRFHIRCLCYITPQIHLIFYKSQTRPTIGIVLMFGELLLSSTFWKQCGKAGFASYLTNQNTLSRHWNWCNVGDLYLFCRYFNGDGTQEIANLDLSLEILVAQLVHQKSLTLSRLTLVLKEQTT